MGLGDFIKRHSANFLRIALRPKTTREKVYCVLVWAVLFATGGVLIWKVFPLFVDDVLDPSIKHLKRNLNKASIGTVVIVWLALVPLIFVTTSPAIVLAAAVFPLWSAWALVVAGFALGETLPFFLGRKFLPRLLQRLRDRFASVEALFEIVDIYGVVKVVIILRLSPVSWAAVSYLCSSHDRIAHRYPTYIGASMLASAPLLFLDVFTAGQIYSIAAILKGKKIPTAQLVKIIISAVMSVIILIGGFICWRAALKRVAGERAKRAAESGTSLLQGITVERLPLGPSGPSWSPSTSTGSSDRSIARDHASVGPAAARSPLASASGRGESESDGRVVVPRPSASPFQPIMRMGALGSPIRIESAAVEETGGRPSSRSREDVDRGDHDHCARRGVTNPENTGGRREAFVAADRDRDREAQAGPAGAELGSGGDRGPGSLYASAHMHAAVLPVHDQGPVAGAGAGGAYVALGT